VILLRPWTWLALVAFLLTANTSASAQVCGYYFGTFYVRDSREGPIKNVTFEVFVKPHQRDGQLNPSIG
jgi:hypothetical protein